VTRGLLPDPRRPDDLFHHAAVIRARECIGDEAVAGVELPAIVEELGAT